MTCLLFKLELSSKLGYQKYLVKYLLEFIIILTGISIFFYVEKQNVIKSIE